MPASVDYRCCLLTLSC